jgi:hypothetical protein
MVCCRHIGLKEDFSAYAADTALGARRDKVVKSDTKRKTRVAQVDIRVIKRYIRQVSRD